MPCGRVSGARHSDGSQVPGGADAGVQDGQGHVDDGPVPLTDAASQFWPRRR
jgi:hypothetical protein